MFRHLLIPLDGSRLAESVLPAAAYLAQRLTASITLIHFIERKPPEQIHGEPHLSDPEKADAYLATTAKRAFPSNVKVERHVHSAEVEDVARSIVEHVGEFESDLIVMCTHGRSGFRELLFGSIAQQVIALGRKPVLVIHPSEEATPPTFTCRQILTPLDGQPDHEHGLTAATEIARICQASLHLVMVVQTFGTLSGEWTTTSRLLPGATGELLDMAVQNAEEYLSKQQLELQQAGLSVGADVLRGDPADSISIAAKKLNIDLIVMGTHGKAGTDAFWSGSTGPRISRRSRTPLLLVPIRKSEKV